MPEQWERNDMEPCDADAGEQEAPGGLAGAVLAALDADFKGNGKDAVQKLRESDLKGYFGLIGRFIPQKAADDGMAKLRSELVDLAGGYL